MAVKGAQNRYGVERRRERGGEQWGDETAPRARSAKYDVHSRDVGRGEPADQVDALLFGVVLDYLLQNQIVEGAARDQEVSEIGYRPARGAFSFTDS
jgi:hypothetical protein